MPTYASDTSVSTDKSMLEIRRTLQRYKAAQIAWAESDEVAMVQFVMAGRHVRLLIPMPDREDKEFKWTNHDSPRRRTVNQQAEAYEQAVRQRWRALNLVIKAKLEAVEAGIASFEIEFLGHIMLPNGQTVGEAVAPGVEYAYTTNQTPELLPSYRVIESGVHDANL